MAIEQDPSYLSPRAMRELEAAERVAYFDHFVDMVLDHTVEFDPQGKDKEDFDAAIDAYKETLEYQGIPLSPA